ncbi:MAG: cupin domain-containing protein [Actinobacteria bacterium]|nr:cupin domain-containing protein [Actinomycetota bacterium]
MNESSHQEQASGGEHGAGIVTRRVLQTTRSWNDVPYEHYPAERPELTVVHFDIPPHSSLPWHTHAVPNAAYVIAGALTVEDHDTGRTHVVRAGEAFGESVGPVHRGYTEDLATEVVAIYAGAEGIPLSTEVK